MTEIYFAKSHNETDKYIKGYTYLCKVAEKEVVLENRFFGRESELQEDMLEMIGDSTCGRQVVRKQLMRRGYDTDEIRAAFKQLEMQGKICFSDCSRISKKCMVWRGSLTD